MKLLNATGTEIEDSKLTPQLLSGMLDLIDAGTLSGSSAKAVFEEMFHSGRGAAEIVDERGLTQISDAGEIEGIIDRVIQQNEKAVADYRQGKEQAQKFLVGQVMRETKGRANPQLVNKLLEERLAG